MSVHLITTSEESSWPDKGKVVFLGEWCKRQNREKKWSKFDSTTAIPYAVERKERKRVNDYSEKLFKILLNELADELNKFHCTSYSNRYWSILIGPWLRNYIKVIINRYNTLESALINHQFSKTIVLDYNDSELSPQTYKRFMKSVYHDDLWNHRVYIKILENWPKLDMFFVHGISRGKNQDNLKDKEFINKSNWKVKTYALILSLSRIFSFFKRNNDAVILKTYLPFFQEIKLQLALGQFPQFWKIPEVNIVEANSESRAQFFQNYNQHLGLEREVRRLVHTLIPICYLEGYRSLYSQVENCDWPSKPKFVFTSNSFSSDEVFKLWVAEKVEEGVPYYIGQHGNNYGTLKSSLMSPAMITCDKFFSWGWESISSNINVVPAFIFKTINMERIKHNKQGGMLFIGSSALLGEGRLCQDQFYEHILYQKQVLLFFDTLKESIRRVTTARLHISYLDSKSFGGELWRSKYPTIEMNYGYDNIFKEIAINRLTIFSYDSTGILESLSLNTPIVCFWYGGLDDLLSDAIPYYELLIDAGIVHLSPKSAANHITKYWDDIDEWWYSEKIQNTREKFCNKYARKIDDPIISLRDLLLGDIKSNIKKN